VIIDAYTFCWNEEIRLKYFLRLWSPICRRVHIYDNGSSDESKTIASQYDNVVWDDTTYGQNEINDRLLRQTKNLGWKGSRDADLVFMGDVDEIVHHPMGLEAYFDKALGLDYTVLQPYGYDMISKTIPVHDGNIFEHDDFKFGASHPGERQDKCVTFSPKHITDINFDVGAHYAKPTGTVKILRDLDYKLLHYKYINKENFVNRTMECGKRLCEKNRSRGWGKHYLHTEENLNHSFDKRFNARGRIIE